MTDADVIVIGGGPAGMMAAGRAAELGAKVLLLEKNGSLGKKLLITGGGRCNVSNAEEDLRTLLSKFKSADKFLFSPFSQFDNKKAIEFFEGKGMPTKVENAGRVFPVSDSAQSVWDVLARYMKGGKVEVRSDSPAASLVPRKGRVDAVRLKDGTELRAAAFILATGGMSRPETGSTGDGFRMLRELGHSVSDPRASLVPVAIEDAWVKALAGVTLTDVKLRAYQRGQKHAEGRGKLLFTHVGVSGPTVLNMSKDIGELLTLGDGAVELSIDLLPAEDFSTLNEKLQELFMNEPRKQFKNALPSLIPSALAPVVAGLSGIEADTQCNAITRAERVALMRLLKDVRVKVSGLLGADKAIIMSGGVALTEIDTRTFASKMASNLYIVGDVLDIDRPSGGYSLQLCWTSGFVAGSAAAEALLTTRSW